MASLYGDPSSLGKSIVSGFNAGTAKYEATLRERQLAAQEENDIVKNNLYRLQAQQNELALQQERQKMAEQEQVRRAQDLYEMAGRTGNPSDFKQALADNEIPDRIGSAVQASDPKTKATQEWLANAASMAMVADNSEYEPTMRALYKAGKAQGVDFSQFGINSEDEMAKVPRSSVAIATGMVSHDTIKEIVKQKSKLLTENQDVMSTPQLYVNPQNGRQEMWYFRKSGEPARFIRVATKQDIKGPDAEKPLTGDTAGKLAMLNQASRDISELPSMLYVNGKLDLGRLTGGFFGAPSELGREINSRIDNAVAAKLRAETGAAATPGEVENISKRFKPKPGLDDEKAVSDKLTRLKEYLDEAAYFIDPQGAHRAGAARDRESKGALFSAPKKVGRFIVEVEGK